MYLKVGKSNGKTHLSFVQGYREGGKVKQRTIETLGYLEDLEKVYDDPISHFRKLAKERTENGSSKKSILVNLEEKLPEKANLRKNLGYSVIKSIYSELQIREFFQYRQRFVNVDFNLNSIFSLLVFNRFLFPNSKKSAFEGRNVFFESFDVSLDDIYRSLNHFQRPSEELQQHLHQRIHTLVGRESQLGYYDVTNYYFEIPYEDEDEYDEDGVSVKKGSRKRGPSKEHRKDPIIQMGLLMDTNGIPMAFNIFSGGDSENHASCHQESKEGLFLGQDNRGC